jgi:hypothetical protein
VRSFFLLFEGPIDRRACIYDISPKLGFVNPALSGVAPSAIESLRFASPLALEYAAKRERRPDTAKASNAIVVPFSRWPNLCKRDKRVSSSVDRGGGG